MPRPNRQKISEKHGSVHIISHTAGGVPWLEAEEKEHFLKLLKRFASGFFVDIHAFCIMSTHFHVLATERRSLAKNADAGELLRRYRLLYEKDQAPPPGSYKWDGTLAADEDGGTERLRRRLGSLSRFVQELKQSFSRWYNLGHNRKGTLWAARFKGIIVEHGGTQLSCSAYMDLNPVRAGIVQAPEDYRWSSLGMRARNPAEAKKMLTPVFELNLEEGVEGVENTTFAGSENFKKFSWYREFVYTCGGVEREGKGAIPPELVAEVKRCHGRFGIKDRFRYRVRNMSEGVAIGSSAFIADIQEKLKRKFIRPRRFLEGDLFCTTRVLRQ